MRAYLRIGFQLASAGPDHDTGIIIGGIPEQHVTLGRNGRGRSDLYTVKRSLSWPQPADQSNDDIRPEKQGGAESQELRKLAPRDIVIAFPFDGKVLSPAWFRGAWFGVRR